MSPFLAWGDFHARSRFARSTIPEEKWGLLVVYEQSAKKLGNVFVVIITEVRYIAFCWNPNLIYSGVRYFGGSTVFVNWYGQNRVQRI